jgi:phosphatidylserine/phosphatidylglycerophosphate/cardiolipin synthase-like enzyme
MAKKTTPTPAQIDKVIKANLQRLRKEGVLTVRPGYEIAKDQLTGKSAIVATVHTKTSDLPKSQLLPNTIANIPVDVREATAHQRLRAHDPAAAALTQDYARPEDLEPTWPYEREMPSGEPLAAKTSATHKSLLKKTALQPAIQNARASHAKKPQIPYVPAPGVSLAPITTTTTITAHVSPDAGLATLQAFLKDTETSLVIGMYDFTSGPILKTFEQVFATTKKLQMVLDNPAPNPTRDQTDTQTVQDLDNLLEQRAQIVRALDRSDSYVTAWIFPYAYHIKVIVRDDTAFWLSSGNLNNSNQPDLTSPPTTEDRDWHVIIQNPDLAKVFAAFLTQDFNSAKAYQVGQSNLAGAAIQSSQPNPTSIAVSDAFAKLAREANPLPPQRLAAAKTALVPAKTFENVDVTITPLLTPDTVAGNASQGQYLTNILKLIASAEHSLYIQLQYIEASKSGDYDTLLKAIAARVADGVDVKLIESRQYGEKWAEKMKDQGVDLTANIALQSNVHNKGFVIDSKVVVVSSQNFSPAGIRQNRDAGVIIENSDIAQYFERIFLSDWENKAKPFAPNSVARRPKGGAPKKKTPAPKTTRGSAKRATKKRAKSAR